MPIFPNRAPIPSVFQPTPVSNTNVPAPCLQTPSHNGNGLSPADVAQLIAATRKEPLPEWKLPEFSGNPLQWPEWFGQFKSAVDSATLTDAAKMTYLKTLVTGKAKAVIEGFAYCGSMYQEALKALERKYGQPQTVVSAHLEKLSGWPNVKMHNSESLIAYANVISSLVGVFKSLGFDADLRSSTLLMQAVSKLPPNLKEAWAMYTVKRNFLRPTLNDFNEWLQQKSEAHDRMQTMPIRLSKFEQEGKAKNASRAFPSATQGKSHSSNPGGQRTPKATLQPTTREPCVNCEGPHPIFRCPDFLKKTPTERAKLVADKGSCFSCLGNGHGFRQCTRNMKCPSEGCNSSHNRLLHGADRIYPRRTQGGEKSTSSANKQGPSHANQNLTSVNSDLAEHEAKTTSMLATVKGLLQVVKVEVAAPSKNIQVMALCDTGCTHSWITSRLANELKLEGEPTKLTVKGFNSKREIRTAQVNITLRSVDLKSSVEFTVRPFTKDDLGVGTDEIDLESLKRKFPHLSVVPGNRISYSDVELILGQDIYEAIRPIEYVKPAGKNVPLAVLLPLGWVTSGPVDSATALLSSSFTISCTQEDQDLAEEVRRWYDIESFGTLKDVTPRSKADARATEILERTTRHDGERYEVGMLWAEENSALPNNFFSALAQLKSLERRLEKDNDLKRKYAATIADDFSKGYIEQVDPKNDTVKSSREWYLPHHPVMHPNKPGKVRRVLNGAAKFRGHSLNKSLLTGPDLLQNLVTVSLRFRRHAFAVSADIESMFLQVGVPESDRPSIRFLWREDPNSELVVYQYTRHIFGAKDSPTCANYALRQTAEDNRSELPEAASFVEKNFYMDDYLGSFPSTAECLQRSRELTCLLRKGGFKLTKFVGNFPELEQIEPQVDSKESLHVLGLEWNHKRDTLVVSRGTRKPLKQPVTQRTILSCVASVFDPIGLVAPYTVKARLMLKDIWRTSGQNWDAPLPTGIAQEFASWSEALPRLIDIQINRPYFESEPGEVELHVFGDSSQLAFGAVVFLRGRLTEADGSCKTQIAFVFGKSRVAPMKALSIPKLELQAALLAARLKSIVCEALDFKFSKIFMWTDSTTVIQWLLSDVKQPVFVANRVSEILELTTIDQWSHVGTIDNPADDVTRGLPIEGLNDSAWVNGPEFLKTDQWPFRAPNVGELLAKKGTPTQHSVSSDEAESVLVDSFLATKLSKDAIVNFQLFSSYRKLVRVLAYVLRARHPSSRDSLTIDPAEFVRAEVKLLALVQQDCFADEYRALKRGETVSKTSKTRNFTPFLGSDGLMRCTGRLRRLSEAEFGMKHPIILDGRHHVVRLLLKSLHEEHHHQGVEYMRALMQQRFAVISGRSALRSLQTSCVTCRRFRAKAPEPLMADLPKERLGSGKAPFTYTGVDYFGPLYVTVRRSTVKRWGFLFTCLTTRAVHIEVAHSLNTDSCVMGIERFIARRGRPSVIFSDNGTNFVGAEKELVAQFRQVKSNIVADRLASKGILWKFNPPAAPHHGGSWERLVQSCKRLFYRILGTRRLTDEVLSTTLCLVEQFVNNRPLVPASSDPSDMNALTPNHFLIGGTTSSFPFEDQGERETFNYRKRFQQAQAYTNVIWKRWLQEYAPTLNVRRKWNIPNRNLKKGDLVWLVNETNPRGNYPLGRIEVLTYGVDGIVRSATVRTTTGQLVRPVTKLVPVFDPSPSGREDVACVRE